MTKQSHQRFMLIWSQVWDFVDIFYAFFFFLATQILTALALAAHLYQKDTLCHLNEFSFWIITIDNILLFFASYFTYVTRLHALPVTRQIKRHKQKYESLSKGYSSCFRCLNCFFLCFKMQRYTYAEFLTVK